MTSPVVFMFAGRRANMEVQWPYLVDILNRFQDSQVHLWDLSRTPEDAEYLRGLDGAEGGRVQVLRHLRATAPRCLYPTPGDLPNGRLPRGWRRCECIVHKPPYEKPYTYYAVRESRYRDTLFLKIDDDVLFLETARLHDLFVPLVMHPNAVVSANVINNAVCAKYEPELVKRIAGDEYDPRDPKFDRFWWNCHTAAGFANLSHEWFLEEWATLGRPANYVRTRPGEAVSINCIAFTHTTMKRLSTAFVSDPRLGDEGVVDSYLPWIARSCHAAHLAFGPQEAWLDLDYWRAQYTDMREAYLGE